ncbi:MAG: GntR family transcriptional regulator [Mycobacteriales bacterium]
MSAAAGLPTAAEHPDHVYDEIRRAVVEGRYAPGMRLVEQRLAEEFEVSRTPVREALRRLESEGLVVVERHRGAEVRRLTAAEIADLYDVRSRLEAYAAELAAERGTEADVAALDVAAEGFDSAVAAIRDGGHDLVLVRRLDEANSAFHGALLDASRHTRIRQLVGRTVDVPLVFQALRHFGPEELARSSLFHHLIRDAVAAHEPVRAGRLMAEHVLQGRDALLERLQSTEVSDLLALAR